MLRSSKVATPSTAVTVVVPESVPPAGLVAISSVTSPRNEVAILPSASRAATATGPIVTPAVVWVGCVRNVM